MAGRIRSIKPELLEDEKTAELSSDEWRLFVSMLLLADDYGNARGTVQWIHGQVFWAQADRVSVAQCRLAIQTLCEVGLVETYEVRGQPYLHIAGWTKHQRVDKPGKPRVPPPEDTEAYVPRGVTSIYAVQQGEAGPIKIGKAYDVDARVRRLQTASPVQLRLLASASCGEREREFHARLENDRMSGEWFQPTPDVLAAVEEIRSGTIREPVASDSGTIRESFATDLRPPTTDHRPGPTTPTTDRRPPSTWRQGEPIASVADLEVAAQRLTVGGLRNTTRAKAHGIITAGAIQPHEWSKGMQVLDDRKSPPRDPLAFVLGVIDSDRSDAEAEAKRQRAGPLSKPTVNPHWKPTDLDTL